MQPYGGLSSIACRLSSANHIIVVVHRLGTGVDNPHHVCHTWGVRPKRDEEAAADLGARLAAARAAQHVSFERVGRDLEIQFGVAVSATNLRDMHAGRVDPAVAALEVLAGLARLYGLAPAELGPVACGRIERADAMMAGLARRRYAARGSNPEPSDSGRHPRQLVTHRGGRSSSRRGRDLSGRAAHAAA